MTNNINNNSNNNINNNSTNSKPPTSLGRRTLFKRPCSAPQCPQLVSGGDRYCDEHKHLDRDDNRPNSHQRGYNARWRKERKLHLMNNPWCEECLTADKTFTPATEVDHIIPHRGNQELFWDYGNWQSLCKACHGRKTATEDNGGWY